MILTDDKKANIFRKLASKTLYEVGIEFGLDKHYSSSKSMKGAVYTIYRKVQAEPEKYAIQPETVTLVVDAVSSRSVSKPHKLAEKMDIDVSDLKGNLLDNRNLTSKLVRKKLNILDKSPKALSQVSLVQLTTAFAILFDKSQIIQGQATEHVALMGKIDTDMKPEQALEMVLKLREMEQTK